MIKIINKIKTLINKKCIGVRETYYVDSNTGIEYWKYYDEYDNIVYYRDSNGCQYWREYDNDGYKIHHYNVDGKEYWENYDKNGKFISYTVPHPSYPMISCYK